MKINQIIYVLTVAKHKNFSKAADELFVSQPAISSQIKALENELNIEIFQRDTHKVVLTPIGEIFCNHARIIVNELELLQNSIKNYTVSRHPIIKIGVFPFYEFSILKDSLVNYFYKNNHYICNIEIMENSTAIENLLHAKADIIFVRSDIPFDNPNYNCLKLSEEEMYALFNKKYVKDPNGAITPKELSQYGLMTTSPNTHVYKTCQKLLDKYNQPMKIAFMTNSDIPTFIDMVHKGVGTILLSKSLALSQCNDDIIALKVEPTQYINTYMIYPKNKTEDPFYKEIIQHISNSFEKKI